MVQKNDGKNDGPKANVFTKIVVSIIAVIMLALAVYSFFNSEPRYAISDGIIYIFIIVVLLFVSETIETLSVGNLFTIKKEVKNKEKEVEKLTTENKDLRNQLMAVVSTSINSKNQNNTYFGFDAHGKMFRVEQATEEESRNKENIENEIANSKDFISNVPNQQSISISRSRLLQGSEETALNKFMIENDVKSFEIKKDIKFSEQFIGADPIMDRNIIFDAYIKRPLDEVFVEVRPNSMNLQVDFRLYYMISKIYHYSKANQAPAKMILIVPRFPQEILEKYFSSSRMFQSPDRNIQRLNEVFAPAINTGLLEISEIEITEDECASIVRDAEIQY